MQRRNTRWIALAILTSGTMLVVGCSTLMSVLSTIGNTLYIVDALA